MNNTDNDLTGRTLGTCILEKLIGQGGMGAVYLARQIRPSRYVAVKVLLPNVTANSSLYREFLTRFRREADVIARLEQIGVESLLRMLDAEVRDGVTELNCHPGYVEPGFPSSYAAEREKELRTLCDPRVRHAIVEREIRLIGFRELPALATPASMPVMKRAESLAR